MSTSLSIKGKSQSNEAVTSTLNYVNPNATDANLVSLATAFNNLTTNTVSDITRIDKNSLMNTIEKLPRNLQISPTTISFADTTALTAGASITGAGITAETQLELGNTMTVQYDHGTNEDFSEDLFLTWYGSEYGFIGVYFHGGGQTEIPPTGTITFTLPETDTYKESSVTLEITT